MERDFRYYLEQTRSEKIKSLGFLCYNLHVDGVMSIPKANETVAQIREKLNELLVLRENNVGEELLKMQESDLNEKLIELGCICYNLYVDRRIYDSEVLILCDSISAINKEIANAPLTAYSDGSNKVKKPTSGYRGTSKLKVNCPYGMEPIPIDFKECMCGYRNRAEAKYCAKCGAIIYVRRN